MQRENATDETADSAALRRQAAAARLSLPEPADQLQAEPPGQAGAGRRAAQPRAGTLLSVVIGALFAIAAAVTIVLVNRDMRRQALTEAHAKMRLILDRNLAVHAYFSRILKPALFAWTEPFRPAGFFDSSWMSSTYAVREMGRYFREFNLAGYYYKDATINARSPANEADADERVFILAMRDDPALRERSSVRRIDGKPCLVVLRRGEVLEESCLACHGEPEDAPADLLRQYGSTRSFHRQAELGSTISAASVRVPLVAAYAEADRVSLQLSAVLLVLLGSLFGVQLWLSRRLVFAPLATLREKALQMSLHGPHVGEHIPMPFGEELGALARAFNTVSHHLREEREHLEARVQQRTADLERLKEQRERLQDQFVQAQKIESVGRLAGGVAHEFNNKLMGIMNYVELCQDALPPEHVARGYLDEIIADAQRSADIARQMLAFASKQVIIPQVLDLSQALTGMALMLRHLLGEDIELVWHLGRPLWPIRMDPGQLDQVLANLCANARDAIAGVGTVTISTANTVLNDAHCAAHAGAVPGDYVVLTVCDTGHGMSRETLEHLFEPFFTTKGLAEGTGLGLAAVYGIVRQNAGQISVHSEPGRGTTFSICLPRASAEPDPGPVTAFRAELPRGTETVLLAEDEKSVRTTISISLKSLGYTVLVAESPANAIRLAVAHRGEIELLITDVIMPGMSGRDLARRLLESYPRLKCLFMSGYSADAVAQRGVLEPDAHFLAKPFSRESLVRTVREVLDEGSTPPPSLADP